MISRKPTGAVIHFYEKMIDKTVLVRFTTDFIMKIFELFYRKKHPVLDKESEKIIQSIQATLFAKTNEYARSIEVDENNVIEIQFEKNNLIPIVQHYKTLRKTDVLLTVSFKKIGWDEINVFRSFFVRYISYYFAKFHAARFKDQNAIKKIVTDLSYIIQELLQNANAYSIGEYDYELVVKHISNTIKLSVENYTNQKNIDQLKKTIDDINQAENLHNLILDYMLSQEKHLGLISSVFNNDVEKISCSCKSSGLVKVEIVVKIHE